MRKEAIFFNGIWKSVLQEILEIQTHLPEQILYLQPFSTERVVQLAEHPPSVDDPVRLFASVTDDLATVRYVGEIVGWDDKRRLAGRKLNALNRVIRALQPNEGGVYGIRRPEKPDMVNLIHVRRMQELSSPFSVGELTLTSTGEPHSTKRASAGGWSYVVDPGDLWLQDLR